MMVYTMLCRSRAMRAGRVRAAAVVIGGMGRSFADGCTSPARVPLMILHGAKDEHIPYNRPVVLDYVPFMSTGGRTAVMLLCLSHDVHVVVYIHGGPWLPARRLG
jgi:hypothetical protein